MLKFKGANIRYVNLHDNYKNNNNNNNNRTLDTLVGGEHSHRCAIPAPHLKTLAAFDDSLPSIMHSLYGVVGMPVLNARK